MLNELAQECHAIALEKGWYDETRTFPELIALMHSELSEALEAYRNRALAFPDLWPPRDGGKPEGASVELADCIIRILDCAAYYGMDLDKALESKMRYNRTRPYRHGDKRA